MLQPHLDRAGLPDAGAPVESRASPSCAIALAGPFETAGDATFAAEVLGFISTSALLDSFWVNER